MVPHILEEIFFSMDYKSFKNCVVVCRSWKNLLTSDAFQRIGKSVFSGDIKKLLRQAIEKGNTEGVRRILSCGMFNESLLIKSRNLSHAARYGHKDVAKLLLDAGAAPNMADHGGYTPLITAADRGRKDLVQLLLDRGAQPNMAHHNGATPLDLAILGGHRDVVLLLIDGGAEPNMADPGRILTPLTIISHICKNTLQGVRTQEIYYNYLRFLKWFD